MLDSRILVASGLVVLAILATLISPRSEVVSSRLTKGWQYRSSTLTADLVAQSRGEAHII